MRFLIWTELATAAYCLALQPEPVQSGGLDDCDPTEKPSYILNALEECPNDSFLRRRSGIPLKMYITHSSWTLSAARLWERNRAQFPDFFAKACVKAFTDEEMACSVQKISAELERENITGAYEAFKSLRPGAYRADLWRYMILWAEGGIYMDSKMAMWADPRKWIDLDSDSLVLVQGDECPTFWNGVMAARAHSEELRDVIAQVIRNVQRRDYKEASCDKLLSITGPGALAEAMQATSDRWNSGEWYGNATRKHVRVPMIIDKLPWGTPTTIRYVPSDLVVAKCNISGGAHKCARGGAAHYSELYSQHQVYCDESGPLCNNECPSD